MATMRVLCLCLFFAMISSINAATNACYAPPFVYSPQCSSSTAIFGSNGYKVGYSISQVNNVGTQICCKVRACGPLGSSQCSSFGFYSIGCSSSSLSATLPWGNNVATPAIKCYGNPFGTSLSWSP